MGVDLRTLRFARQIMDGAPVRGESVPVRLFLSGFDLTPTYRNVNNKFSVKYTPSYSSATSASGYGVDKDLSKCFLFDRERQRGSVD